MIPFEMEVVAPSDIFKQMRTDIASKTTRKPGLQNNYTLNGQNVPLLCGTPAIITVDYTFLPIVLVKVFRIGNRARLF